MMTFFRYIIRMLLEKKACLSKVLSSPECLLDRIEDLTGQRLKEMNVKLFALDFDGVLSHHGSKQPSDSACEWLDQLDQSFSLENVCIYSNNLFPQRIQFLNSRYPNLLIVHFTKKKPYPDDLLSVIRDRQLNPEDVLVVDDRLTSGVLAACIVGARAMLLNRPLVSFKHKYIIESYFVLVRCLERWIVRTLLNSAHK